MDSPSAKGMQSKFRISFQIGRIYDIDGGYSEVRRKASEREC
jgi:hypothetical protein